MGQIDKHLALIASAALLFSTLACAHNKTQNTSATDTSMEQSSSGYSSTSAEDRSGQDQQATNDQSAGYSQSDRSQNVSRSDIRKHQYDRAQSIRFPQGKTDLTDAQKKQLSQLVDRIRSSGQIEKAEVAVWSDKAFPANRKDLSSKDQDLADKRADNIETYLKDDLKVGDVTTFNMAETSNWLARMFNSDEAELKSVFSKEGAAPLSREDFDMIKRQGAASMAVVVIQPKVAKNDQGTYVPEKSQSQKSKSDQSND